jgi:putative aldouronate transport system substrate-binding protein
MKKASIIIVMLMMALSIGLLAACNGNETEAPQPEVGGQETPTPTPTPTPDVVETPDVGPELVHLTFNSPVWGPPLMDWAGEGRKAPVILWLEDKFNMTMEVSHEHDWGDWVDNMRMWLMAGIAPDIISLDVSVGRYGEFVTNAVEDRFFRPYNLNNMPNLRHELETGPSARHAFVLNGNLYAWPNAGDQALFITPNRMTGFIYRHDWALEVGLAREDSVYTYEQWIELIQAVQAANPGNVPGGVVGVASNDWQFPRDWPTSSAVYGMNRFVRLPNGEFTWGPLMPEVREAVELIVQHYNDGIIWADQPMVTSNEHEGPWNENRMFAMIEQNIMYSRMEWAVRIWLENNGLDHEDPALIAYHAEHTLRFGLVEAPTGGILVPEVNPLWSMTAMNANISDAQAERWEQILDFLVTDAGYFTRAFGIQGQHWDFDANGEFVLMWEREADGTLIDPQGDYFLWPFGRLGSNVDARFDIFVPDAQIPIIAAQYAALLEVINGPRANFVPFDPGFGYFAGDLFLNQPPSVADVDVNAAIVAAMVQPFDVAMAQWDAWVAQRAPMVQPIIDELNANLR